MPKKRKKRYLCRTIRTDADNVMVHVELVTRKRNVLRVEMCYCPSGYAALGVGNDGEMQSSPSWWLPRGMSEKQYAAALAPCLMAISFMNCKNVAVSDNEPATRKKSELRAYRGPMVRYKTLEIEPMKKVLRTEGRSEEVGLKRALHICRGHFSTYSEDKPLFGRSGAHGNFWIPAHVRGTTERGVVVKDYAVQPPVEENDDGPSPSL